MDFFRKERFLFWCIVVLMLLNVVLVASFWLKRPPFPPPGPGGERGGGRIMEEQLQLSEEQAHQFEQIRQKHFSRTDPLEERVHEIRMTLLDEIFAIKPNEVTIQALCAEIGQTQCQFDRELFNHFRDLKDACKDQQVTELKHMLANLLENRRPPGPRQPHPGSERGPGPGHPSRPPGYGGGPGPGNPPLLPQ